MLMSDRRRIDGRLFFELADPPFASAGVIASGTAAAASAPLDPVVDALVVETGLTISDSDDDDKEAETVAADALAESTATGF
jgi:hypothetical protein